MVFLLVALFLGGVWGRGALAQIPLLQPSPTPSAPESPGDPLRRETPRGAFLGFIEEAQRENWGVADQYLQWPKTGVAPTREELARELEELLNQRFSGNLDRLSRSPLGAPDDGLPPEMDRAGQILTDKEPVDVLLVREARPGGPGVWLISSETLREVPKLYRRFGFSDVESRLPGFLVKTRVGSLPLWQFVTFLLLLPILYVPGWFLVRGALYPLSKELEKRGWSGVREGVKRARTPLAALLTLLLHRSAVGFLELPLLNRYLYGRLLAIGAVAILAWLLLRMTDVVTGNVRGRPTPTLTLGRRLMKGAILLAAFLVALSSLGVNLTAALAGLGIGGIALAFAAQKSLENLFGGFFILGDRIVKVGDTCRIGEHSGDIEDVTLYATRLRTADRTVVYIPNGQLATSRIENLSRRDKFRFAPTIGLSYGSTPVQVRQVLDEIRRMLEDDPRVETATARVRFIHLGPSSLDLEVFSYILAPDYLGFLGVQEELLLKLLDIVERAGTSIAFPPQTVYLAGGVPPPGKPG